MITLQRIGFVEFTLFTFATFHLGNELAADTSLIHCWVKEFILEDPGAVPFLINAGVICINSAIATWSVVHFNEGRHLFFQEQVAESIEVFLCFYVI